MEISVLTVCWLETSNQIDKFQAACDFKNTKMGFQYTVAQRSQFVTLYFQSGSSSEAAREFARLNPGIPTPTKPTILNAVRRHEVLGSQTNQKRILTKRATTDDNVTNILAAVSANRHSSVRGLSAESGLSKSTVHRILKENKFKAYKVQFLHKMLPTDYPRRLEFCETMLENSLQDPTFIQRIAFGDEACFFLNGEFNHHNMRLWSQTNQHWAIERRSQDSPKLNVWAGIFGDHVLGPYFFEGNINAAR